MLHLALSFNSNPKYTVIDSSVSHNIRSSSVPFSDLILCYFMFFYFMLFYFMLFYFMLSAFIPYIWCLIRRRPFLPASFVYAVREGWETIWHWAIEEASATFTFVASS